VVDLKASGIQIVSSVIGSSLLVFAITTFYSDFLNKPNVSAMIIPGTNYTSIELTNKGRVPANNLVLTVESPVNITDYEIFSTENWTRMVQEDNFTLVAQFPRLVQGDGSLINIVAFTESDEFKENYFVYATYDEGSLKIRGGMQQVTTSVPYGLTIALTVAALLVFAIPYFYRRAKRNRQRWHNTLVSYVIEHISYVKKYCQGDPLYFKSLKSPERLYLFPVDIHQATAIGIMEVARTINDIKGIFINEADFYVISDFYKESARRILDHIFKQKDYPRRENYIVGGEAVQIQKYQNEIAVMAEKTLNTIHWKNTTLT
jgi:hypothetical protein